MSSEKNKLTDLSGQIQKKDTDKKKTDWEAHQNNRHLYIYRQI